MKQVKCVMIVEDNEIDSLLAQRAIEIHGISSTIITSRHGADALKKLEEYFKIGISLPEVILIDLQMPLMNGFELIEAIKALPYYSKDKIKLVAISASMEEEEQSRLKLLDIAGMMDKPFEIQDFVRIIN